MKTAQWCNHHFKDAWICISKQPMRLKRNKNKIQEFLGSLKAFTTKMSSSNQLDCSSPVGKKLPLFCWIVAALTQALHLISVQQTHRDGKKQKVFSSFYSLTACNSSRLQPKASLGFIIKARPGSLSGSEGLSGSTCTEHLVHTCVGCGRPGGYHCCPNTP